MSISELALSAMSAIYRAMPFVLIGTGALLFSPDGWLSSIGMLAVRDRYASFIGGVFLLFSGFFIANLAFTVGTLISARLDVLKSRRAVRNSLRSLTDDEKAYLFPFVFTGEKTCHWLLTDSTASGLVSKGILYRAASTGQSMTGYAHGIQPYALKYLKNKPGLLKGAGPQSKAPDLYFH